MKVKNIQRIVERLDVRQFHAMATLGVQRLYEMAEAARVKNKAQWVRRRLKWLASWEDRSH